MFPSVAYESAPVSLGVGDMVVLFTDGITESRNKNGEEFGEKGLVQLLRKNVKQPAAKIVGKVCDEVSTFTSGVPQMDDMTFIVIKRTD
jgi:serine phosphatase RsbU (regulator of sigma subunit)